MPARSYQEQMGDADDAKLHRLRSFKQINQRQIVIDLDLINLGQKRHHRLWRMFCY
jgi:hypothetical protein